MSSERGQTHTGIFSLSIIKIMSGKDSNTTFGLINFSAELGERSSDIFFDFFNVILIISKQVVSFN